MCFDSILQSVHYSADEISSKSLMEVLSFSTIYILYLFSATLFFHSGGIFGGRYCTFYSTTFSY